MCFVCAYLAWKPDKHSQYLNPKDLSTVRSDNGLFSVFKLYPTTLRYRALRRLAPCGLAVQPTPTLGDTVTQHRLASQNQEVGLPKPCHSPPALSQFFLDLRHSDNDCGV